MFWKSKSSSENAVFHDAVETHLFPVAADFRMKVHRIDERCYGFSSEKVAVKIYFPLCHGVDVTVCLSPKFNAAWNADSERGVVWFVRFLGLETKVPERIWSRSKVDEAMRSYSEILRQVLEKFRDATPERWNSFSKFFDAEFERIMSEKSKSLSLLYTKSTSAGGTT